MRRLTIDEALERNLIETGNEMMPQDMPQLKFASPTFRKGLNLSVRRGMKWDFYNGDKVALTNVDGTEFYDAVPIITETMKFIDIPEEYLFFEHDEECRRYGPLLTEMRRVYTDPTPFEPTETVTLVWFVKT